MYGEEGHRNGTPNGLSSSTSPMRIDRAEDGNFGDSQPVGGGISEIRVHCGAGYRVYFAQRGLEIVILLAGGDKSTKAKDIKTAIELARQL